MKKIQWVDVASIPGLQDTIISLFWGELSGKQQNTKGTLFDPSLSILMPGFVLSVGPINVPFKGILIK